MFRITLILIFLIASECLAQPKDFYEQDFPKSPLDTKSIPSSDNDDLDSSKIQKQDTLKTKKQKKSKKEKITASIMEVSGTKIKSIGVIVAGEDTKHLEETFLTLKKTASEKKLPIGEITAWGGFPEKIDEHLMTAMVIMGAQLKVALDPADTYSITQSPTWVLETKDGVVLLEGIDRADRYINSKGEFVERK